MKIIFILIVNIIGLTLFDLRYKDFIVNSHFLIGFVIRLLANLVICYSGVLWYKYFLNTKNKELNNGKKNKKKYAG